ncbi:hypothetical protein MNVM_12220 [Mycobacterium novum]|uniref:Uncharacterized protein n=1 Tax=Mycobacterium novum TaxID=2492438 RepID=A0A7I7JLQ4_9MYCO|nr:DUF6339 family protein [Mycobacterium novum]BBX12141.1 hypothetical protein MNVM_12220 [Mycobacterium novum]
MSDRLSCIPHKLDAALRARLRDGAEADDSSAPVERRHGETPSMSAMDSLMGAFHRLRAGGEWADRSASDRWLAPRVHYALRLHRIEAADRGLFQWVALRYADYVEWRWADAKDAVAEDRWWGPIHKQAFARLWWGAELFRDGSDYRPVERAFVFQDLPNSYLHRPLIRCRSLALALVERISKSGTPSSDQVNALARVLNLATAGAPPELETGYEVDDLVAYDHWATTEISIPSDWGPLPAGPAASDTTAESLIGGAAVVDRGWGYANLD